MTSPPLRHSLWKLGIFCRWQVRFVKWTPFKSPWIPRFVKRIPYKFHMNSPFSPVTSPELITRSWRCRRAANRCVDPWAKCTTLRIHAKGPLATLGDLRIRSFSVEKHRCKSSSKRFWSLLILVFFVFVWSWSWIAKYRSGPWQDSSSAKPVIPGTSTSMGATLGPWIPWWRVWLRDGPFSLLAGWSTPFAVHWEISEALSRWPAWRHAKVKWTADVEVAMLTGERPSWGPSWRSLGRSSSPDARSTSSGQMPRDRRFGVNIGRTGGFSRISLPKSGKTNL